MALHPDAAAKVAADRARLRGPIDLGSRYGARTKGTLAEVGIGWEVWTVEDGRRNHRQEPLGGIVVEVRSGSVHVDDETGEVTTRPAAFRCYDTRAPFPAGSSRKFVTLSEDEVHPDGIEVADPESLVTAIEHFCRAASTGPLVLDAWRAELITYAYHLTAVVMGKGHA